MTWECVSHVLPCNLLTSWQSIIQIRETSRLNWQLLDCHTSHAGLFLVIPTFIPTHTVTIIQTGLLILFLWDYVCAPSDTHLLLEKDHISKMLHLERPKTIDNVHDNIHIYCNRLPPETYLWELDIMAFLCKTSIDTHLINVSFIIIYSMYSLMYSLQYRCATF